MADFGRMKTTPQAAGWAAPPPASPPPASPPPADPPPADPVLPHVLPPHALPPRRRLLLVALVSLLGLGLGIMAAMALSPRGSDGSSGGVGALGNGPGVGLLASAAGVPSGQATAGPGTPSSTPTGQSTLPVMDGPIIIGPTLRPPGAPDPLVVSYVADNQLTAQAITITVTNPAKVDQTWDNVALGLQGITLKVSTDDPNVTHKQVGWAHCFFAGPRIATVTGGTSVTFTANVVGLLGRTASVGLDQSSCG